jgi:hypothetical protein
MLEVINHVLNTPYIWSSLGSIVAIAMFIGPILYNGDLTMVGKSIISIGLYVVFCSVLIGSHAIYIEHLSFPMSAQPFIFLFLVAICYLLGIYLGVLIHVFSHCKK